MNTVLDDNKKVRLCIGAYPVLVIMASVKKALTVLLNFWQKKFII